MVKSVIRHKKPLAFHRGEWNRLRLPGPAIWYTKWGYRSWYRRRCTPRTGRPWYSCKSPYWLRTRYLPDWQAFCTACVYVPSYCSDRTHRNDPRCRRVWAVLRQDRSWETDPFSQRHRHTPKPGDYRDGLWGSSYTSRWARQRHCCRRLGTASGKAHKLILHP